MKSVLPDEQATKIPRKNEWDRSETRGQTKTSILSKFFKKNVKDIW